MLPCILLSSLLGLSACQVYEPYPLELEAERSDWHARTLEQALAVFADFALGPANSSHGARPFEHTLADGSAAVTQANALVIEDGLTLGEAQRLALVLHPELRMQRMQIGVALASQENAQLWEDPEFAASILRITDGASDPWVIAPALSFTIPLSARLARQQDVADATLFAVESEIIEAEWEVQQNLREAWVHWEASEEQRNALRVYVSSLEEWVQLSTRLVEVGELARAELSLVRLEQEQRRHELLELDGQVERARETLREWIGLAPGLVLPLQPAGLLADPSTGMPSPALKEGDVAGHPALAHLEAEYALVEETLRLEIERQMPDLTFGVQYESDAGQDRFGLLAGLPVPVFDANRKAIAAARMQREAQRTALAVRYEQLAQSLARTQHRAATLGRERESLEQTLVPMVERQMQEALELMRLGEGSGLLVLESLKRAHEIRLAGLRLREAQAKNRARWHALTQAPQTTQAPQPTK